jgi:hypothetical protein
MYWNVYVFPVHAIRRTYGGVKVELHSFSTSALEEDEWSVSRPLPLCLCRKSPRYRLGGLQGWSQLFRENTNHMSLRGIEASSCGQLALSLVIKPTALYRLTEMLRYHTNIQNSTRKQAEKPSKRSWCNDVFKLTGIFWRNSPYFSCTHVHSRKAHRGSRCIDPLILNLGIR